jgi:glycosyltransferase involved in cell wall biosynthesis
MTRNHAGRYVVAVVPAYNEGPAIAEVLDNTLRYVDRVVLVDDASTDDTAASARRPGVDLLSHPVNLGQGAALQTGITHALAIGATHIVTLDADGQHDPSQIQRMLDAMQEAGVEAALGSRFKGETIGMPALRRAVLKLAVVFTRLTTGLRVTDSHNGFRVLSAAAARRLRIRQNRMAHASEILEEIARKRIAFVEVPVTIRYTDYSRAKGQSSLNSFNIVLDLALHWLRK